MDKGVVKVTDINFYNKLNKYSGIDDEIISDALKFLPSEVVDCLFDLFTSDKTTGRIPYFKDSFYPYEFYDKAMNMSLEIGIAFEQFFLYLYVAFAEKSSELYKKAGLDQNIFFDSFRRIAEESEEYKKDNGIYGLYDYHFIANHVRGSIIRLGVFEYGYGKHNGKKSIFLHVPPATCLERDRRHMSYSLARKYFGKYDIIADSWLLYPEHKSMLPTDSNILDFASDFDILSVYETYDYNELFHIFGRNADYSFPDKLPQNTLLQREYIKRIKEKQPIGSAVGKIKL